MARVVPSSSRKAAPSRARVLIVDPDLRFGRVLQTFLQARGWQAEWVPDGRVALQRWDELRPDLVVTELQGEELDGFEFLDALTRRVPSPPVVVCTRLAGVQGWSDGVLRSLGVRAVRVRPIRLPELARTIEDVMAKLTGTMTALPTVSTDEAMEAAPAMVEASGRSTPGS